MFLIDVYLRTNIYIFRRQTYFLQALGVSHISSLETRRRVRGPAFRIQLVQLPLLTQQGQLRLLSTQLQCHLGRFKVGQSAIRAITVRRRVAT
jgi:hypothetical protein